MNELITDLSKLPTLSVGQEHDLKIDTGSLRVWLSRVDNSISYERLINGKWELIKEYRYAKN